ncbi:hypothetical protein V5O48_017320 [Marasmius crinis-equi]|uniref:Uncharacterized protein n=1 Tax=Marasmius crinis-equi TaxID=585013 RepID=A0ABR3EPF8_9AGAR
MEALSATIIQNATPEQLMENKAYRALQVQSDLAQHWLRDLLSFNFKARASVDPEVKYIGRQFEGDKGLVYQCNFPKLPPDADTQYDYNSQIHPQSKAIIYVQKAKTNSCNTTKVQEEDFKYVEATKDQNDQTLVNNNIIGSYLADLQDVKAQAVKMEDCD